MGCYGNEKWHIRFACHKFLRRQRGESKLLAVKCLDRVLLRPIYHPYLVRAQHHQVSTQTTWIQQEVLSTENLSWENWQISCTAVILMWRKLESSRQRKNVSYMVSFSLYVPSWQSKFLYGYYYTLLNVYPKRAFYFTSWLIPILTWFWVILYLIHWFLFS